MRQVIFAAAILGAWVCAYGRLITVDDDGAADFSTIQAAIDDANHGDTVIVQPGVYTEQVHFLGKNITLTGTQPTDFGTVAETVIDRDYGGPAVRFLGTEDANCSLRGFDINGFIVGVDFEAFPSGTTHSRAGISHCLMQGACGACGTAIAMCDGEIVNCLIAEMGGCPCMPGPYPTFDTCGGTIRNCTVVKNRPWELRIGPGQSLVVENSIIDGGMIIVSEATRDISYSNLCGGIDSVMLADGTSMLVWGTGNVGMDPCFAVEPH